MSKNYTVYKLNTWLLCKQNGQPYEIIEIRSENNVLLYTLQPHGKPYYLRLYSLTYRDLYMYFTKSLMAQVLYKNSVSEAANETDEKPL